MNLFEFYFLKRSLRKTLVGAVSKAWELANKYNPEAERTLREETAYGDIKRLLEQKIVEVGPIKSSRVKELEDYLLKLTRRQLSKLPD